MSHLQSDAQLQSERIVSMGDELQSAKHQVQALQEQVCLNHSDLFLLILASSCSSHSQQCASQSNADSGAEEDLPCFLNQDRNACTARPVMCRDLLRSVKSSKWPNFGGDLKSDSPFGDLSTRCCTW